MAVKPSVSTDIDGVARGEVGEAVGEEVIGGPAGLEVTVVVGEEVGEVVGEAVNSTTAQVCSHPALIWMMMPA